MAKNFHNRHSRVLFGHSFLGRLPAVPARRALRGRILKVGAPEWEPLLNLASDHVVDFMWMGTVLLADGTRIQVYKHYWTRDYLHLADDGRAFVFVPKTRYEEVNPPWLLMRVLRKELDPSLRYSVRQNAWPDEAKITFARSATKHRISRERSRYVIDHCGLQLVDRFWNPATDDLDRKVYFLGDDLEEVALEVVAVESWEEDFRVIHAMELREKFGALYEEARAWAK